MFQENLDLFPRASPDKIEIIIDVNCGDARAERWSVEGAGGRLTVPKPKAQNSLHRILHRDLVAGGLHSPLRTKLLEVFAHLDGW